MSSASPTRRLTNREWQVVGLLGRGWSSKRIATELGCKPRTVEAHIEHVAASIPNPESIPARTRVMLWARDRNAAA